MNLLSGYLLNLFINKQIALVFHNGMDFASAADEIMNCKTLTFSPQ